MGYWIVKLVMKGFIGAVIVLGFFGPYIISIILSLLCLAVWAGCRSSVKTDAGLQDAKLPARTEHKASV